MLTKIPMRPGVVRDDTPLASEGTWTDADKVRFVRGQPETIGGWETITARRVDGRCRRLHAWADNAGTPMLALGTHTRLYAYIGGALADITPVGLAPGLADGTGGAGFGTGAWGTGGFGATSVTTHYPRTWTLDNWGQNLVACPRGGPLYQWAPGSSGPAAPVAGAPGVAEGLFVTPERILVAYGAQNTGAGAADLMLVRWSDQEDTGQWTPASTNMAGDFRLSAGSRIVRGLPGRGQHLLWTDSGVYAMRFLGDAQLIYAFSLLGTGCGLIGPGAAVEKDGTAYWLSNTGQFYLWQGGAPVPLSCPLQRWVMDHLAWSQADKIVAGTNAAFGEVWWFYPDRRDGNEVSRYVALNTADGTWTCGTLNRTAWVDAGVMPHPIAVGTDGGIYYHERLASANGGALAWRLVMAPFDVGDGDRLVHMAGVIPDFERLEGGAAVEVAGRLYPTGPDVARVSGFVTPALPKLDVRITARQIAVSLAGNAAPASMRLGALRLDLRESGSRR